MAKLSLSKLKWVGILVPAGFLVGFEYLTHFIIHPWILSEGEVYLLIVAVIGLGAGLFSHALFVVIGKMQRQIIRREQEAEALYRVSTEISALSDVNRVLNLVVEKARALLDSEAAVLCLRHAETRQLVTRAGSGTLGAFAVGTPSLTDCPAVYDSGLNPNGLSGQNGCLPNCAVLEDEGLQACLAVPLRRGEERIGALCVGSRRAHPFTAEDHRLLDGLATQAAIAIENARLYEQTQQLAVLEERDRIAREMHDGLAQILGYIGLKAKTARELLARAQVDRVGPELDQIESVVREAHADIRECILGLKSTVSGGRGLLSTLQEYVRTYSLQNRIRAELVVESQMEAVPLSPTAEVQLLRIVQEALTNVRKHAAASRTWVRMGIEDHQFKVTIADNGRGFRPAASDGLHFGLQTMKERAQSVGGTVTFLSQPGQGTQVVALFPLGAAAEQEMKRATLKSSVSR